MMNGIDRIVRIGFTNDGDDAEDQRHQQQRHELLGELVGPLGRSLEQMPSISQVATATAIAVVSSQLRKRMAVSLAGCPESFSASTMSRSASARWPTRNSYAASMSSLLEQPHQGRVRVGLVVGVAPQPVDLGERELELEHQVLLHRDQPRRPGQADQRDVEVEVPLVELLVRTRATRSRSM